ncbi:hypothetical protein HZ326_6199 [Fusarium oxysporum f. sp. albedinis]|nr:hypothetical protein HZ326_6199 [Fusarium oxysporum f. sp. albedinis]
MISSKTNITLNAAPTPQCEKTRISLSLSLSRLPRGCFSNIFTHDPNSPPTCYALQSFFMALPKVGHCCLKWRRGAKWPARLRTRGHRERRLHQPDVSVNATPATGIQTRMCLACNLDIT